MARSAVVLAVAVLGLAFATASGVGAAADVTPVAGPATVADVIAGYTFVLGSASLNAPGQGLRVRAGDTVSWTNLDPVSHSVAFDARPQWSRYLKNPGDTVSVTFTEPGYFTYRCNEHPEFPGMKGLVFVTGS